MFVVAITRLGAAAKADAALVEREAQELAPIVGTTPYELRLALAGGTPAIVMTTVDVAKVRDVAQRIRQRGHGVVACETSDVVPCQSMIQVSHFRFGELGLELTDKPDELLPYTSIAGMFRATHKRSRMTQTEHKESTLSLGRAAMTGGLAWRKTVSAMKTDTTEEREQVLYLFRKDGGTPWILREAHAKYEGLGDGLAATQIANFFTTVEELRARATRAQYDERLLTVRKVPERMMISGVKGTNVATSSEAGTDLLAHLLAISIG